MVAPVISGLILGVSILVGDIENLSNELAIKWKRYHNGSYSALFSNLRSGFRKLSRVSVDRRKYTGIGRVLLPKIACLAVICAWDNGWRAQ